MAHGVVDDLEIVQVDEHDAETAQRHITLSQRLQTDVQPGFERPAVCKPGQVVGKRETFQALRHPARLGHVPQGDHCAFDTALAVTKRLEPRPDDHRSTGRIDVLEIILQRLPLETAFKRRAHLGFKTLRANELRDMPSHQFKGV